MAQVVQRRPGAQEPQAQRPTRRNLPWPIRFVDTTVGMKWVMALSGIMLIGFIVFHMIGNWKMFIGAEDINHYGEFLRELLYPILPRTVFLWIMRIGLIGAFLVHILAAYRLVLLNRQARPVNYQSKRNYIAANYANRTMAVSGTIVLAYLLFHLADLTWGATNPDFVRGLPYENFVASMSRPPVAIFYIIANLLLATHLYHGAWSMFQSLGVNSPKYNTARRGFAIGLAVLIGVGNSIMPLAAMTGIVS
ncbi:MAG: succinate dehydrogenase cytochrome b subunit [Microthrixaceae bacterium]|nr:succinate dehydrogenase cytochrome b subunit [Microthrixaceae bacterium]